MSDRTTSSTLGARTTLGLVVLAVLLVLTVLLIVQNFQTIEVQVFREEFRIRLGWALVVAAVVGASFTLLFGRLFRRR